MKEFFNLHRNLQWRIMIVFLSSFSYGTVFSSMTIYYTQHVGAAVTGAFLAISSVATFVAGVLAGYLADLFGRKPVMMSGTMIQAVGGLIALASNLPGHVNPWTTFLGFLMISFGFNLDVTAGSAMVIDDSDAHNRKVVFMLNYWAQNLAIIVGAALGAWLFKPAFIALLLILLATIFLQIFIVVWKITETYFPKEHAKVGNIFVSYKKVFSDHIFMIYMAANMLTTMVIMQFDNFLPVHLASSFQTFTVFGLEIYGQRMLTIYLILACVLVVFLMTAINHFTAAWSNRRGFIIGSIFMTAGMIWAFMTTTFWPIFLAGFVYTFGEIVYTPSSQNLAATLMNPEQIGAYNGVSSLRTPIASVIAAGLVSISPIIKAFGVSVGLFIAEIAAILLCLLAVSMNSKKSAAPVKK